MPEEEVVETSPRGRYLRFNDVLGKGAYKEVWRSYDTIEGIEVAWNVVNLKNMPQAEKARVINEVKLLDELEHENIIDFHGSWVNRERGEVVFVTEILSSGSLKKFINKIKVVRWKIVKRWCKQILRALAYLHAQEPIIIHRDIKCDNIFINGASGDLRIGDLGLSTAKMDREGKGQSVLGTPEFMAPELYDENYDEKVDIYAFGMCALEMITKQLPYAECLNATQIYRKVTANVHPDALELIPEPTAREFVECCLDTDPNKRPSAEPGPRPSAARPRPRTSRAAS
ncbi:kinase-like domain-containing protein [Pelagophyceae sp. CCMP2097]|nr:kinase-like domain-containing protein [Pelagophyceae sp. CCMP2097]